MVAQHISIKAQAMAQWQLVPWFFLPFFLKVLAAQGLKISAIEKHFL